jgi:hypothetical protein
MPSRRAVLTRPTVTVCFLCFYRGTERLLTLASTLRWTEDYSSPMGMRPYPTRRIKPKTLQTILIKANKGIGKSKAGTIYLKEMLTINPSASCVVIAGNVALEELHRVGLSDFVLYSEVEGSIEDRQVVVCINSVPRLSSFDKDIVYMDEIDMTLSNLSSDVIRDRRMVFMGLHEIVETARIVVGLEANVDSAHVVKWLEAICPAASIYAIKNTGVRLSERTATIKLPLPPATKLKDRFAPIVNQILANVEAGENIWVSLIQSVGEPVEYSDRCSNCKYLLIALML